jgi:hypothetical protein
MTDSATDTASSSLYKYVSVTGLRRILDGSIRFSQPSAFNDPFEFLPEIVMPDGEPERRISLAFDIMAKRRHPPVGDVGEVLDQHRSSDATARSIVEELNRVIGVFCLSRVNDSLLMWSHYADQYAGAVVEFDGSHEFFAGQIDVEYRPQRPRKHVSVFSGAVEPVPVAELCVKSDQWKYEREVRIVRQFADCEQVGEDPRSFPIFVQKIPLEAINSITLGERTPVPEQREIYQRIKETKIFLLLAAIDDTGYGFRREIIKYGVPASQMGPAMSTRTAHIFSDASTLHGEFARLLIEKHPLSRFVNKTV